MVAATVKRVGGTAMHPAMTASATPASEAPSILPLSALDTGHLHGGVDGAVDGLHDEGDGGETGGGGDSLGPLGVDVRGGEAERGGVHDAADEGTGPEHGGEHLPGEGVERDDGAALGLLGLVC